MAEAERHVAYRYNAYTKFQIEQILASACHTTRSWHTVVNRCGACLHDTGRCETLRPHADTKYE